MFCQKDTQIFGRYNIDCLNASFLLTAYYSCLPRKLLRLLLWLDLKEIDCPMDTSNCGSSVIANLLGLSANDWAISISPPCKRFKSRRRWRMKKKKKKKCFPPLKTNGWVRQPECRRSVGGNHDVEVVKNSLWKVNLICTLLAFFSLVHLKYNCVLLNIK